MQSGNTTVIPVVASALKSSDSCVRRAAADILGRFGTEAAITAPDLIEAYLDDDSDFREAVAKALCKVGKPQDESLTDLINAAINETEDIDFNQEVRCIAGISGKESNLPLFSQVLAQDGVSKHYEVFSILEKYQSVPGALEFLIENIANNDELIRELAAETLVYYGDEAATALPGLKSAALKETDEDAFEAEIHLIEIISGKEETLPYLISGLSSSKYEVRRTAASELAGYEGFSGAINALETALYDSDSRVSALAASSLAIIAGDSKESVLLALSQASQQATEGTSFSGQITAIKKLGGKETALPVIKKGLESNQVIVRYEACEILATYYGIAGAEEALQQALQDNQSSVRQEAEESLEILQEAGEKTPDLVNEAKNTSEPVKFEAIINEIVEASNEEMALPLVEQALNSNDAEMRSVASKILGTFTDIPGVADLLAPMLQDSDESVRKAAIQALGTLGKNSSTVLPELIAGLETETRSDWIGLYVSSINQIGGPEQTISVIGNMYLEDEDLFRETAAELLPQYSDLPETVEIISHYLKDENVENRKAAAETLTSIGSIAGILLPDLIEVSLQENSPDAMETEIDAIADLTSQGGAIEVLAEIIETGELDKRVRACEILRYYQGVPGAIDTLVAALDDPDTSVRTTAVNSLAKYEFEAIIAVPDLIELLNDYEVKEAAANALNSITGTDFGVDVQKWETWWTENSVNY